MRYLLFVCLMLQKTLASKQSLLSPWKRGAKLDFLALKIANVTGDDYQTIILIPDHQRLVPEYSLIVQQIVQKRSVTINNNASLVKQRHWRYDRGVVTYIVLAQSQDVIKDPDKLLMEPLTRIRNETRWIYVTMDESTTLDKKGLFTSYNNIDPFWSSFNIFELIIGMPAEVQPRNIVQKIFFICFATISMIHTADFYSDILEITYSKKEMAFETFKQLHEFDFDIYINRSYKLADDASGQYHLDSYANDMLEKAVKVYEIDEECLEKIRRGLRVMCISAESDFQNKKTEAKPAFYCQNRVYKLSSTSPYAEKLQAEYNRLFEAEYMTDTAHSKFQNRKRAFT
ncbi:hypothetical protein TSAR_008862 [Trichomalopsis sarcophagae]|uniref:Ionotropic glutamate receptor C-terminal domain-containing protein n=1 Tax=Trichomalopsis sarcophagae TaxID=543379 RepID=A0A232F107_9HYME|nr:hypothetical protein TSAR_008862 [Trichomalopsis sarcophagae]